MKDPKLFHRAAFSSSYSGRLCIFVELYVLEVVLYYLGFTLFLSILPITPKWSTQTVSLSISILLAIVTGILIVTKDPPQSLVFWKFLPVSKKMMHSYYEKEIKIRKSQTQFFRNRMNEDMQETNKIEAEIIDLKRKQAPYSP